MFNSQASRKLKYLHTDFNKHFDEMLATVSNESKEIIVMGDMNIDYLKNSAIKSS